jgi:hypothetical protein
MMGRVMVETEFSSVRLDGSNCAGRRDQSSAPPALFVDAAQFSQTYAKIRRVLERVV